MVTNDLNGNPFQLGFVRPAQMMMFAKVVCDPPLGQFTVIPHHQKAVNFTVLIESSRGFPEQPWEVVLWHNGLEDREWDEVPLERVSNRDDPMVINTEGRGRIYRRYFSGSLPRPSRIIDPIDFTLKYRTSSWEPWKWVKDQFFLPDGKLHFQPKEILDELDDYIADPSYFFTVHSVPSEVPETNLWSLTADVSSAQGNISGYDEYRVGLPMNFTRWYAAVRIWSPWLAPRHGWGKYTPMEDAILCSFLRHDGLHLVLLAVSAVKDVTAVFKTDSVGNVIVTAKNDSSAPGTVNVIASVGKTFESANAAIMYHARKLIRGDEYMSGESKAEMEAVIDNGVKAEWMEDWYDGLTYCTWNGLGQDLTEAKILHALDILEQNKIQITNLIIDDNWQSLDNPGGSQFERGWMDFDANKEGFPQGLKHTVSLIRERHKSIQHIAVWHAMLGYWGAISPDGNIAQKYQTRKVSARIGIPPRSGILTVVDADDAQHIFLQGAGIDAVKTDAQFFLDLLQDADDRQRFTKAYQDAWSINNLRYFSSKAISCMSQIPQILFHSQMPTTKPRLMVRNSDDFFPEIPASHPWHVFCNAHNSLFTQHLNILPDWDMFQTSHPYSSFHAAARCVSGGPVYFTDEPGRHDIGLINQMTARTPRGNLVTLRPDVVGKTINAYVGYDEDRMLKVGTYVGGQGTGTGILGVFNVSKVPLSEFVSLSDFPGVMAGEEYVVRAHTTGEVSGVMKPYDLMALASLELEVKSWEILSSYPVHAFTLRGSRGIRRGATKVAVIGLLGKMTGAAAVVNSDMDIEENGRLRVFTSLKALGVLGIYVSDLEKRSIQDDFLVTILGKVIPFHAVTSHASNRVLEVDVERAWKEMDLTSGWSNEVAVEIFIR
ncbi:Glycosyl hydrolases 36 [Lasallia pustulata]|uniref:Glycosyl hydrolases 36 n=1 Tax=Lasallia pustulata TaxID=136370 RepID=A0A1W5D2W6_9LECA|nr:Glycosyl hydrolases 36 [Lasallia pustulata]